MCQLILSLFHFRFTSVKAFRDAVSETADLAGQHEVISETLTSVVLTEIGNLVKEFKEDRKKVYSIKGHTNFPDSIMLSKLEIFSYDGTKREKFLVGEQFTLEKCAGF